MAIFALQKCIFVSKCRTYLLTLRSILNRKEGHLKLLMDVMGMMEIVLAFMEILISVPLK